MYMLIVFVVFNGAPAGGPQFLGEYFNSYSCTKAWEYLSSGALRQSGIPLGSFRATCLAKDGSDHIDFYIPN